MFEMKRQENAPLTNSSQRMQFIGDLHSYRASQGYTPQKKLV
jgi:hypothetical protein